MSSSGSSSYWANHLLDLILGATAFTAPTTVYLALFTQSPTAAGVVTHEATGSGYARATVTNNTTNWPAASSGVKQNGTAITFPTATGDWASQANLTDAAIWDSLSASTNELYFGTLTQAKPVLNGDTASFAINAISITVS
jgi:hypothetical protein